MNKNKTLVPALALSLVVASTAFAASTNGQKSQGATTGPRSQVTTPGCEGVMNPAYEPKQPVRSQPSQRDSQRRNTQRDSQKNWDKDQAMEACPIAPPAPCYSFEEPVCENCLGPENVAGNPAVNPITCNGDIIITASGLYWTARADGLESAIETAVVVPPTTASPLGSLNNLIDAEFIHLPGKWDPGFKVGIGYASTYDGWDVGILWTSFTNHSSKDITQLPDDNHVLLPLWSGFSSNVGAGGGNNILWATQIESDWRLRLNIADAEVGREFWNSKYLTLRPFIGLRYTWINQKYNIQYRGGSWSAAGGALATNGEVTLENDFNGIGIRGGLSSNWYLGRGFAIFGSGAVSIVYGRFSLSGDEDNRLAVPPFTTAPIAEWEQGYRSSKAMTDLQIGLEWNTLLGDCGYGFTFAVAWEHHMFFNQNQLWTIARQGGLVQTSYPNNTGSNVIDQRNGDVATQGWTFTAAFQF